MENAIQIDNSYGHSAGASTQQQPDLSRGMVAETPNLIPSFAGTIELNPVEHECYEFMLVCLGSLIGILGSVPCCICCPNPFKTISQGQVGLISKFGKFYRSVDPGLYRLNLCTETIRSVDIKIQIQDIPRQIVMTKDNVGLQIDSVLYWHIVDPYCAAFMVSNVQRALIERTQTTLRHIIGTRSLQDCIEHRDTISHEIQQIISEPAQSWGVKIESILIKDLQFSADLLESLSAAAKQKRIGESKVIAARAEVESARLMREASDILNTPAAMQIRHLETLCAMAKASNTKVVFMPPGGLGDGLRAALKPGMDPKRGGKGGITELAIMENIN